MSELFFRNVPKTAILAKKAIVWHVRPNLGKMRIFLKKGLCYFLPLFSPNFMPSFGKILWAVSEINSVTDVRTDKGDIIELVPSLVQKFSRPWFSFSNIRNFKIPWFSFLKNRKHFLKTMIFVFKNKKLQNMPLQFVYLWSWWPFTQIPFLWVNVGCWGQFCHLLKT